MVEYERIKHLKLKGLCVKHMEKFAKEGMISEGDIVVDKRDCDECLHFLTVGCKNPNEKQINLKVVK